MTWLEWTFWMSAIAIAYTYVVYPLVLLALNMSFARPVRRARFDGTVSIIVAAHDEQERIAARRDELLASLRSTNLSCELIIVSDGSGDQTAAAARDEAAAQVRVIELQANVGKAQCLNIACSRASGDV